MYTKQRKRKVVQGPTDAERGTYYPHPFPSGWYRLADSDRLHPGDLQYIECLGRQLVLWRTSNGEANVMRAFCPHLGANLAHGCVINDRIQCPFHGWQFTADGRAAHVPYSEQYPKGVLTETFPVQEVHGQIFMYHDACADISNIHDSPPYSVPRVPEVDDDSFVYRGNYDAGRVKMHLLEFAENSADTAHFLPLHAELRIPWTQIRVPGVSIEHKTEWYVDAEDDWKMYFLDNVLLRAFGKRIEKADASAVISFFGPGSLVTFRFTIPNRGEIEMYQTHLPIGPLEQQVNFRWFADRRLPRWLVWYVIGNWISQWARDIAIWENKIFQASPRLSRDDGPIFRLRAWYQQFIPSTNTSE